MGQRSEAADPVIHLAAVRLARRCVGVIEPLLRQEEKPVACEEFYFAIRETLESLKGDKR